MAETCNNAVSARTLIIQSEMPYSPLMTTLEIKFDVPDTLAHDARSAGLLEPQALAAMLRTGVRKSAVERIQAGAERGSKSGEPPMRLVEIQAIVDEVRKSRKN